jgi:glutamine amidotransferase
MIAIVDYGMGNLGSLMNMFKHIGIKAQITSDPETIKNAEKLLLPGVGSFDHGVQSLKSHGLFEIIDKKVRSTDCPILGICLGMQLMGQGSQEGSEKGFGWFNAEAIKFQPKNKKYKVPHMGWNFLDVKNDCPLLQGLPNESRFYFVHSYHFCCHQPDNTAATTNYEIDFSSVVWKDNIFGAQFHPEKSHKFGMKLLENFGNL